MNRSELIRRMVLNSVCDDYENIDQVILRDVAKDAVKLGFTVERSEIVDASAGLIEDGWPRRRTSTLRRREWISICPTTLGGPSTMKVSRSRRPHGGMVFQSAARAPSLSHQPPKTNGQQAGCGTAGSGFCAAKRTLAGEDCSARFPIRYGTPHLLSGCRLQ